MHRYAAVVILLMPILAGGAFAQTQRPRVEQIDPAKHHQDLTLRITADQTAAFTLPTSNSPIRFDLSATAVGSTTGEQPNPILRSGTFLHASLTDLIFLTNGDNPAVAVGQSGVSFTNQPGRDGVRVTIAMGLSSKGVPKQLELSSPEPMSGFTMIEVRIALWY